MKTGWLLDWILRMQGYQPDGKLTFFSSGVELNLEYSRPAGSIFHLEFIWSISPAVQQQQTWQLAPPSLEYAKGQMS